MARTKEEAQNELFEKFGLRKTSDFQNALLEGKIRIAEAWLQYIVDNRIAFPQYKLTWSSWLRDREYEIAEAKKNQK